MTTETNERDLILEALARFAAQRPGLDPRNYISHGRDDSGRAAYRSEVRSITKDLHQARTLLAAVKWRTSITADVLKAALRSSYSGRLSWVEEPGKLGGRLEYCTGQYWPTEYRRAVCAVLAACLWGHFAQSKPKGVLVHNSETGETFERYDGLRAGDWIRRHAKREFGKAIASRWFY